ncbi:membrane protein [Streptomyces alboflavus]|uniref:Membrane protein n=2 Tax=Streptomyces alboflavus TaxID=67267 RepID=A0A1Z1WGD2_9ACTN|nr:membrane protein [Streptomyces alboflavus]
MAAMQLTRTHRILIGVVVFGAVVIAGIGFAGSYAAVRELAEKKGFGTFSMVFPIGIDAGICVLLALDLLLTWIRIPFPLLRQTAWLLTAATIAFNGAAAWPDPLGVGMHAVIPVLFVVAVEAARHAIGRIADITADKHMEGVRMTRWLLSPVPTFLLWRRMKLWELRSYDQVIKLEQERLVYQARLRSRFGRGWRRKAPVESLMPLRLARYGVPLAETAPAGLAAAGIEPPVLPPVQATATATAPKPELTKAEPQTPAALTKAPPPEPRPEAQAAPEPEPAPEEHPPAEEHQNPGEQQPGAHVSPWFAAPQPPQQYAEGPVSYDPEAPYDEWYEEQAQQQGYDEQLAYEQQQYADQQAYDQQRYARAQQFAQAQQYDQGGPYSDQAHEAPEVADDGSGFRVPAGPGRTRPLANAHLIPGPREGQAPAPADEPAREPEPEPLPEPAAAEGSGLPDDMTRDEAYFNAFRKYVSEMGDYPNARQFSLYLMDLYGVTGQSGGPLTESTLRPYLRDFRDRYQRAMDEDAEHIA